MTSRKSIDNQSNCRVNIQRPNSHAQMLNSNSGLTLSEKDMNRLVTSQVSMHSNLNYNHEPLISSLKLQEPDTGQPQVNNFVGRRRQSPPGIFGVPSKTPLKLLHYHKKKASVGNLVTSKPIVAWTLSKYGSKSKIAQPENLSLSSFVSEEQDGDYLEYEISNLKQPQWKQEQEYGIKSHNNVSSLHCERRRNSQRYTKQYKTSTQVASPISYLCENDAKESYDANGKLNYIKI